MRTLARVPFDEGSLTGRLTRDTTWPAGDRRNSYVVPESLSATVDRVDALRPELAEALALPGGLLGRLRAHRWDRTPTEWFQ